MTKQALQEILTSLARQYPAPLIKSQVRDVPRMAFHIDLVAKHSKGGSPAVADIGGGIGLFSLGCAAVGMKATLIDDFRDSVNLSIGQQALELHRRQGVTIGSCDVVRDDLLLPSQSLDVITCFDSMEHWHSSPKALFRRLLAALKPGGLFVLSVPNCVNLRKRITVPLGIGKWSRMGDWYEAEMFRGHVCEPDVDDLKYIARDLQLINPNILGRNWLGYSNGRQAVRLITPFVDQALRFRPSLCSNIYLLGYNPLS